MADNVAITAGAGTSVATDDVAGAHYQKVKLYDSTADSSTGIGLGNGTAATALRVTLPTDGTGVVGLIAGSAAIGKLAANTGVDIGDVDVTSVVPGTAATNLGKAEDAGHTTGDVGVMALGVRNDADAAISGTDLDYTPFSTDSSGNQNVKARRDLVRISDTSAASELTIVTTTYTAGDQVGVMFQFAGAARASGGGGMLVGISLLDEGDVIGSCDVVLFRSNATLAANNDPFALDDTNSREVIGVVQLAGAFDFTNNRLCQAFNLAVPYYCSGGTTLYAALITRSANAVFVAHTDLTMTMWVERN